MRKAWQETQILVEQVLSEAEFCSPDGIVVSVYTWIGSGGGLPSVEEALAKTTALTVKRMLR